MTGILNFPLIGVEQLIAELDSATTIRRLYGKTTAKGLWLVSDDGIYLMANTLDGCHNRRRQKPIVVYAEECDPTAMPFDTWWANKRAGDDGVDLIASDPVKRLLAEHPRPKHARDRLTVAIAETSLDLALTTYQPT